LQKNWERVGGMRRVRVAVKKGAEREKCIVVYIVGC
jgi:hypothetical protein